MTAVRDGEDLGACPICGRAMVAGPSVDRHHWVPRKEGGRDWDWLHRVCHKKLHSLFDEKTLARELSTPAAVRARPEIERFVKWVRKQHPEASGRHARPSRRR